MLTVLGGALSFKSGYRSVFWILAALLIEAWSLGYGAETVTAPSHFQSEIHLAGKLKVSPKKHNFEKVVEFAHSAPLTVTATNTSKSASVNFTSIANCRGLRFSFKHLHPDRRLVVRRHTDERAARIPYRDPDFQPRHGADRGGEGAAGTAQSSAELFNVATNTFTLTTALGGTAMTVARARHTATAVGTTTVLIAGGIDSSGNALASAEVFDLSTNSFTAVGSMSVARFDHAAALLPNGEVLITGGEDGSGNTLNTADIYNPATQKFTLTTDPSLDGSAR